MRGVFDTPLALHSQPHTLSYNYVTTLADSNDIVRIPTVDPDRELTQ
jgi:hypothetical protein